METDALRWFQQVADGATVTEVSEAEHLTQSGISRALARLESDVGTPLLRRSGRILRLTRAGSAFKHHVDAMMHQLDDGLAAVSEIIDPDRGTVTLAYQLSLGNWLVPDLIGSFLAVHPGVRFELVQVRDELLGSVIAAGDADLEISTIRSPNSAIQWRRLTLEPLRLAVATAHPLAARENVRLAEAAGEPFVALRPTSVLRRITADLCTTAGFVPQIAFIGDDVPTVTGFVAAGLGVAVVPTLHAGSSEITAGAVRYLPITEPRAVREIGLAASTERRLLPAAESFRDHVVDRAGARLLPAITGD